MPGTCVELKNGQIPGWWGEEILWAIWRGGQALDHIGCGGHITDILYYTKSSGKKMKALENKSAKNVVERG